MVQTRTSTSGQLRAQGIQDEQVLNAPRRHAA